MLDINYIKSNFKEVDTKLKNKNVDTKCLKEIVDLHDKVKSLITEQQQIQADRNKKSALIGEYVAKKKSKEEIDKIKKQVSNLKNKMEKLDDQISKINQSIQEQLNIIPNICDDSVPIGKDEASNKEIKKFKTPTKFNFEPKAHWDLAKELNLFLPEISTKITGSRFVTYWNNGAKLYRALQQFTIDHNVKNGFIEVLPQVIVNQDSLFGSGQLPKFKEDLFKLEGLNYYLSPTAEVQLTNIYRNEIISLDKLPIKLTANTSCFRSEAGSAGRDTRGVIRLHQFYKSELMVYSHPDKSFDVLEEMTSIAEKVMEELELPYRRIVLATGDTGFSSAKTYDLEVWLPSYNDYKEISSCSNCTDFQARRAKIRFKDSDGNNKLVHTLNGSSLAIDRLWVAVVENNQNADGSINIPKALQPYMNNMKKIEK